MIDSNDYYIGGVHIAWVLFWFALLIWFVLLRFRPLRQRLFRRLTKVKKLDQLNKRFASGEINTKEYITTKNLSKMEQLKEILAVSMECTLACEKCATDCILDGNKKCALIARDCADICALTARLVARNSEFAEEMLRLCSDVCKACSEECANHSHQQQSCKVCAEVCRKCSDLCAEVSKS